MYIFTLYLYCINSAGYQSKWKILYDPIFDLVVRCVSNSKPIHFFFNFAGILWNVDG
jgi:hypothetical protein